MRPVTPLSTRPLSSRTAAEAEREVSRDVSRGMSREMGGVKANRREAAGGHGGRNEEAEDGESSPGSAAKPFLKRRSRKVVGGKVDWSHVKPRTVSR